MAPAISVLPCGRRGASASSVLIDNRLSEITTVHWHGMHLPAHSDGGPHQPIAAGARWQPEWSIEQPAATLWYHPHPHGETEAQTTRGLTGLFYLDDGSNPELPAQVRDRRHPDHPARPQLRLARAIPASRPRCHRPVGRQILVNGTYNPHLPVMSRRVRLRILNASTARIYHLAFADEREFAVIATDCGFLPAPRRTRHLLLSPAERAEVLVEVQPGERLTLRSVPWDLNMINPLTNGAGGNDHLDLLQLRASPSLVAGGRVPEQLETTSAVTLDQVVARRTLQLDGREINGQQMEMSRIDTVVGAGTTELWTIQNTHNQPHNFHIHGVAFQIVPDRATSADPGLGWKDTVLLAAGETVRLSIRFPSVRGPADAIHVSLPSDVARGRGDDGAVHCGRPRSGGHSTADS